MRKWQPECLPNVIVNIGVTKPIVAYTVHKTPFRVVRTTIPGD